MEINEDHVQFWRATADVLEERLEHQQAWLPDLAPEEQEELASWLEQQRRDLRDLRDRLDQLEEDLFAMSVLRDLRDL